jgi:hypothetical protein
MLVSLLGAVASKGVFFLIYILSGVLSHNRMQNFSLFTIYMHMLCQMALGTVDCVPCKVTTGMHCIWYDTSFFLCLFYLFVLSLCSCGTII